MNNEIPTQPDSQAGIIPMLLPHDVGICIASLLQLALRDRAVQSEAPDLCRVGRTFYDLLVIKLSDTDPSLKTMFDMGWDEDKDLTSEEFDRCFSDFLSPDDSN